MTAIPKFLRAFPMAMVMGAFCAYALPLAVDGMTGSAYAQQEDRSQRKTRQVPAMTKPMFELLEKANQALEAKNYAEALRFAQEVVAKKGANDYEIALGHQLIGFIYSSQEKYPEAARSFELLLSKGEKVPEAMETSTLYNLAQIYMIMDQYKKGIETLQRWFTLAENPAPDAYFLMAQAYAQQNDYKSAVPQVEKTIAVAKEQGKQVKENWYQLLFAMYYELNNLPKAKEAIEFIVLNWPKKDYWIQLSHIYGQLKMEKEQLAILELAYQQKYLEKSDEWVLLSQLYLYHEIPYKAVRVLEKGLKDGVIEKKSENYELLANAYIRSAESKKSIPYLKEAASRADNGEIYMRLAQVYVEQEAWQDVLSSVNSAFQKGKVRDVAMGQLLRGMAYFNTGDLASAKKDFDSCRQSKNMGKSCSQWLSHVRRQEKA